MQNSRFLHRRYFVPAAIPDQHVARFYSLMIERDLFGAITLVRTWGRIGTGGRERVAAFGTVDEAALALEALARLKRRRSYRDL